MGLEFIPPEFVCPTDNCELDFKEICDKSHLFFTHRTPSAFALRGTELSFESNLRTLVPENNRVYGRFFPSRKKDKATIILPHWNARGESFDRLAQVASWCGLSALRLSLPYHDQRRPQDWPFAKYMVSANIGRTIESVRQAVLDVQCAIDWLVSMGYRSISIIGISIGSCIATITAAHDQRVNAIAQLLMASNFAEAVWTGIATKHIRSSLNDFVTLEKLKHFWASISPDRYVSDLARKGTKVLMITGRYDSVFLPHLADEIAERYKKESVDYRWMTLPCGHYTLGDFPYGLIATIKSFRWLHSALK